MSTDSPIIVAIDVASLAQAEQLAEQLEPQQCRLKIGKELFTRVGPAAVEALTRRGFEVFLDLKFHDIPNTVAAAVNAAADLGVWMVNVHASGGERMMAAAAEVLAKRQQRPLLTAVTVLTSLSAEELQAIGVQAEPAQQVLHLAQMTQSAGVDGVVCSALETAMLREALGPEFVLVTPGIRPAGSELGDQRRVATPQQALQDGSHYLVIGRPITGSSDPAAAVAAINASLR